MKRRAKTLNRLIAAYDKAAREYNEDCNLRRCTLPDAKRVRLINRTRAAFKLLMETIEGWKAEARES